MEQQIGHGWANWWAKAQIRTADPAPRTKVPRPPHIPGPTLQRMGAMRRLTGRVRTWWRTWTTDTGPDIDTDEWGRPEPR